jgi:primosomal protein N' (replication factor Y) (superfamily II helicase)
VNLWKVAVDAPLPRAFSYLSTTERTPGESVMVPFGKRIVAGVVIGRDTTTVDETIEFKEIIETIEDRPILSAPALAWSQWLAKYYHHPLGDILSLFFPPVKKKGRNPPKNLFSEMQQVQVVLNKEQQEISDVIYAQSGFAPHLLWGITGSGKTEVYIDLIRKLMAQNKTALVLVPEIALTPQLVTRFRKRLGEVVAVIHSNLTERERTDQWWSVVSGEKKVLIGARSAIFCPIPHLGIIVVDEEHDGSYKQEESFKYNARDAAVMRAHFEQIPIVLGSATPSLESWKNANEGKYTKHSLLARASDMILPSVKIIDMTEEKKDKTENFSTLPHWISRELYDSLENNYKQGLQSALFINRRGIAQTVLCDSCGYTYMCPNCDISLTLHGTNHLVCHYCDYSDSMTKACPDCKIGEPKPLGIGTEKVEEDLRSLFPSARIARVDRDEVDSRESMEEFINKMEDHEIDIVVGTQMIAKGLDFEKLTLVGVVLADVALSLPDFRAAERAFQLLTQVSGRSGRHTQGHVIIQTYRVDHPSLIFSQTHNVTGFMEQELLQREELHYPPYTKMSCIRISSLKQNECHRFSQDLAHHLRTYCEQEKFESTFVLGPAPAPLLRIRNRYRYHILLKSSSQFELHRLLQLVTHMAKKERPVKVQIDVDPYTLM